MNVEDLIKKLQKMPPYLPVIIHTDGMGDKPDVVNVSEIFVEQRTKHNEIMGPGFLSENVSYVHRYCVLLSD